METSPIEATFSLSYFERLKIVLALTLASPVSMVWLSMFPVFGFVVLYLMASPTSNNSSMSIVAAIGCFGFIPFIILFNAYSAHRADRKNGPYNYRFDDTGLQVISSNSELKQSWSAIPRMRERLGILLLYFSKNCAHCVPVRALGNSVSSVIQLAVKNGVPHVDT